MYNIKVHVILKETVNDPQGHTINRALIRLGFDTISSVRSGKYFEIKINEKHEDKVMVNIPYAMKLLLQELQTMSIATRLITDR